MLRYKIPRDIIASFHSVASENYSKDDKKHIETLAFLAGFREENVVTVTDIIFPKQDGGPMQVDDKGKIISSRLERPFSRLIVRFESESF